MSDAILNIETLNPQQTEALMQLDKTSIGTPAYLGLGYFWAMEYRHYMRPANYSERTRIHELFLQNMLPVDGTSQEHDNIIGSVLKIEGVNHH